MRDHFAPPDWDPGSWSLEVIGSLGSLLLGVDGLRSLPQRTLTVVLECAGHRRREFEPVPSGVPWGPGAVAEARWTGPSLGTALELVGTAPDALEVVLEGADRGPIEETNTVERFARSLPLAKALDDDVLLAHEMNGEPIPVDRGGPVRAIVPGWYATDSVKWLDRVWFTNEEFGGAFQAHDYRFQAPGESGPGRRMTELPVHALITAPADSEAALPAGEVSIRGIAWGGAGGVAEVLLSVDLGPWLPARLGPSRGPYTRVSWEARHSLSPGVHVVACRAVDRAGDTQPDKPPPNVRGYGNNAVHRVRFLLG